MNGQLESSFQWLFVLIAGAFFFGIFFFLIRGCAADGESRVQGLGTAVLASRLEAAAWQGSSNTSMRVPDATVTCIGGSSLAIATGRQTATVDAAPVFLPSRIGDTLSVSTTEIRIEDRDALLRLGGILYGYDQDTYALVIGTDLPLAGEVRELTAGGVSDPALVAGLVPRGARAAIIVSDGSVDIAHVGVSGIPDAVRVSGVALSGGQAVFYRRVDGRMTVDARMPYESEELALGAAVTGDPSLYSCGRAGLATRLRYVTIVQEDRVARLQETAGTECAQFLGQARLLLGEINDKQTDEEYLAALFGSERQLAQLQSTLRTWSCPVIG